MSAKLQTLGDARRATEEEALFKKIMDRQVAKEEAQFARIMDRGFREQGWLHGLVRKNAF